MAEKPIEVDEALIEKVIRSFYNRVGKDPLLGPIFKKAISDWEAHLQKMFSFWSAVMLQTRRYHGRPLQKHMPLPIDAEHFDRWLEIFEETVHELCIPEDAKLFMYKARQIASSFEMGLAQKNGIMLPLGGRFYNNKKEKPNDA